MIGDGAMFNVQHCRCGARARKEDAGMKFTLICDEIKIKIRHPKEALGFRLMSSP